MLPEVVASDPGLADIFLQGFDPGHGIVLHSFITKSIVSWSSVSLFCTIELALLIYTTVGWYWNCILIISTAYKTYIIYKTSSRVWAKISARGPILIVGPIKDIQISLRLVVTDWGR